MRRADPDAGAVVRRRGASRSLWAAVEALLAGGSSPRAVGRALEALRRALDCDGIALHVAAPSGRLEPWCAIGTWRLEPGDLRDCVSVPLLRGEERVGTLDLLAHAGERWRPEQLGLVRTASGALGAALGARLELRRLRHQPGRDATTGLPDARAFHARLVEELTRARRHGEPTAVAHLDLDHFGALNARFGRTVGDDVLSQVAVVLKLALRETDVVARLGGDSFGLLFPETDSTSARRAMERVRRSLESHRFRRVGRLTASAGVAASPNDGTDALELLARADQALDVAKKSGRRRVVSPPPQVSH